MARLTPTVHRASQAGTVVNMTAPNSDGDAIPPGAAVLVTNANAAACVITIDTPGTVGGLAIDQENLANQQAVVKRTHFHGFAPPFRHETALPTRPRASAWLRSSAIRLRRRR